MPMCPEILRKHKNGDIFVETGTETGHGCIAALAAGFTKIYSCDIQDQTYLSGRVFYDIPEVKLYQMHSSEFLKHVIQSINGCLPDTFTRPPILFWLDAHGSHETPILDELKVMKEIIHPGDVMMIDDMRIFRAHNEWAKVVFEEHVLEAVNKMGLKISYEGNRWDPRDILVGKTT